jgi:polyhydroxyalkanoate synthesis regulator protein
MVVVKRYGRNRLYQPSAQRYVSVDDLRAWSRKGVVFQVIDVETGDDITRVLLA